MRVIVTGAGGQLGREMEDALAGHIVRLLTHKDLDITKAEVTLETIAALKPDAVVHAAALTDTTRCEKEPDAAHEVNAAGAEHVALACSRAGAAMVYVSTNEVFDGKKQSPYVETDEPAPLNNYARSKLAGERAVAAALPEHYIVRTAWVYGIGGNNFVSKMLRAADGGAALTGVTDEIATPTFAYDLAAAIAALIETQRYGTYHFTNAGEASRYDWLREILRLGAKSNAVRSISTAEFRAALPVDAVVPEKPPYSVMANTNAGALGITLRPWRDALAAYFAAGG